MSYADLVFEHALNILHELFAYLAYITAWYAISVWQGALTYLMISCLEHFLKAVNDISGSIVALVKFFIFLK